MQLTPHFNLREFTRSAEAAKRVIDNSVPADLMDNVKRTAQGLEEVRAELSKYKGSDVRIKINSGYRCDALNRAVGGTNTSHHKLGLAADIVAVGYVLSAKQIFEAVKGGSIKFDQLIYYPKRHFVHIGFDKKMRGQVLVR